MRTRRLLVGLAFCASPLLAQHAAVLDDARARTKARDWPGAIAALTAAADRLQTSDERNEAAEIAVEIGKMQRRVGQDAGALPAYELALRLRLLVHGDRDHADVAMDLDDVGSTLVAVGRAEQALARHEAAVAMARRLAGDHADRLVPAFENQLAMCFVALGRPEAALPHFEATLAGMKALAGGADSADVVQAASNVARCLFDLARYDEALRLRQDVRDMLMRQQGRTDAPAVVAATREIATCLGASGRATEALAACEEALTLQAQAGDHRDEAQHGEILGLMANCLDTLERRDEARRRREEALACLRSVCGDRDDPRLVDGLTGLGFSLAAAGRHAEALAAYAAGAAMAQRLFGDRDDALTATARMGLGNCLVQVGRRNEGLPHLEAALAMWRRLLGKRDHPDLARALSEFARGMQVAGDCEAARARYEEALEMRWRFLQGRDHVDLAANLNNLGLCLQDLGRIDEAVPLHEASLRMTRRLRNGADGESVAASLSNLALCYQRLGREAEALQLAEQALGILQATAGAGSAAAAKAQHNVALLQLELGRASEALASTEASCAALRRLHGTADHDDLIAGALLRVACLLGVDRVDEAQQQCEAALAMARRCHGDGAHPQVALALMTYGDCLRRLGRSDEAEPQYEAALAQERTLFGADPPLAPDLLSNLAAAYDDLGRLDEARHCCEQACAKIERQREGNRMSAELRQTRFDRLKRGGAFERLQDLCLQAKLPVDAWSAAERSRGRALLDWMEQQRFDPFDAALLQARRRGDDATAARLPQLREELRAAEVDGDRALHELSRLADGPGAEPSAAEHRDQLLARFREAARHRRDLLDECARRLGDVTSPGRVRSASDVQGVLREGEVLLEFTCTEALAVLYVLGAAGTVEALELPDAHRALQAWLAAQPRPAGATSPATGQRGRDPSAAASAAPTASLALFEALIPKALWPRLQAAERVFVAPHRGLHGVSFESLVTGMRDGRPVYWLDEGPPISYVPSASVLHWLRHRAADASDDATSLDLLAVGDPGPAAAEPEVPETGALVLAVQDGGRGARAGLRPGDVIVGYDGRAITDDRTLRDAIAATLAAIEDGRHAPPPVPLQVWRRGETLALAAMPDHLDVDIGVGRARAASAVQLVAGAALPRVVRAGETERIGRLPPLLGARAETEAVERVFAAGKAKTMRLLGADATEPAVFELAAKAKYLHFACHGIAEEYAGQSLSMLVLSPPRQVRPGDDGLLQLSDLFGAWRGRLCSCRLVVLSACSTNVGPTLRDEAPQALPIGFLFAGAPAVISSLWAVDDASTRELMADFYGRLLAGDKDRLRAFTAARKALRAKYPDPFRWAPFLYLGAPD